jgi:hypothetical protein
VDFIPKAFHVSFRWELLFTAILTGGERQKNMKNLKAFVMMFLISSCQGLPQMLTSIENIADDTAIKCIVSKEGIQKDKQIEINVSIKNENDK